MNLVNTAVIKRFMQAAFLLAAVAALPSTANVIVRMQTDLGGVDIVLRDDVAPLTVTNFLDYANSGAYDGTYIHRNLPGFVVQGGGFKFNLDDGPFFGGGSSHIPENDPVPNEAGLPGALSKCARYHRNGKETASI